jgi:hypothetical protein
MMKAKMTRSNLRTAFLAISLLSLTASSLLGSAQQASVIAKAPSLQNFLIEYLGAPESEEDRTSTRYLSATTDLNGDGQPETIVYILGSGWCGTGGCSMLILTTQNTHYKVITRTTVTQLPIRVLSTRTNGWLDLAVWVSGGGIRLGYEAKLAFNGRRYRSNPTVAPAKKLFPRSPGTTLIQEDAESQAKPVYR